MSDDEAWEAAQIAYAEDEGPGSWAHANPNRLGIEDLKQLLEAQRDLKNVEIYPPVLKSFDLAGVADYIKANSCKNVIVMCGAGISVSAGIPDFRTPGTGLYDNLAKYNLPEPTAVFEINFFKSNPAPFYMLAKELFPGQYKPTPTHNFIRLLNDHGLLLRCYTQNIDSLETEAGLPKDKLVAAHGNFDAATCLATGEQVPIEEVRQAVMGGVAACDALNSKYGGLVKPDIVFFGEKLPDRFYNLAGIPAFPGMTCEENDFDKCDLLIVMGTSLVVRPFASLIDRVKAQCPRVLLNNVPVGKFNPVLELMDHEYGFRFMDVSNYRYIYVGTCATWPTAMPSRS
jgi:NAD-dependent deacetylase sirtuin 2